MVDGCQPLEKDGCVADWSDSISIFERIICVTLCLVGHFMKAVPLIGNAKKKLFSGYFLIHSRLG